MNSQTMITKDQHSSPYHGKTCDLILNYIIQNMHRYIINPTCPTSPKVTVFILYNSIHRAGARACQLGLGLGLI